MTTIMRRFIKGIVLRGETSDITDNIEGSLFQNSSDLRIKAYIEGAVRQVVTNSQSQVLTNKTIVVASNTVTTAASGNLTATELNNALSELQTDIDTREPSFVTLSIAKGGTNSNTALSNNRVIQSSSGAIVEATAITPSRTLISDANGIPTHSTVTDTTLSYLDATSSVQTQINSKVDSSGGTLTSGSIVTPSRLDVKQDTAANLTTYALTASEGQLAFSTDTDKLYLIKNNLLNEVPASSSGFITQADGYVFRTQQIILTTQTWTRPSGCRAIVVELVGGGGGGGGAATTTAGQCSCAAGGGGGGYARLFIVNPDSTYTASIGAGGSGGAAGTNGTSGGLSSLINSSAVTIVSANGGGFGGSSTAATTVRVVTPSSAGAGTGGDINIRPQISMGGWSYPTAPLTQGGAGGNSIYGSGGRNVVGTTGAIAGANGAGFGGGGSGASNGTNGNAGVAGGDGANGLIIIYEYY